VTTPADPDPPSKIQLELPFASRQPDEQGIRALFSDDGARAWISRLWNLHQGLLLELAHFYLRDWDRAREVVQDTWVDFLKSLHRFEGRCSAKTWLVQILKRWPDLLREHGAATFASAVVASRLRLSW